MRFKIILVILDLIFFFYAVFLITYSPLTLNALATECCRQDDVAWTGDTSFSYQECPNGSSTYCYLRHRVYTRTLECLPQGCLIVATQYCRPDCSDTNVLFAAYGC
jgi:hypothetical protein